MGFYSRSFVYNNIPSEQFNLEIANIEGGTSSNPGSGSVDIIEQFIFRRSVPFFYGVKWSKKLEFPVSFFSPDEISAVDISYISSWLFGHLSYKRLELSQPDMSGIYLNCIFTDPRIIRAGNNIFGISGTCVADSQFAWKYPETTTYNYGSSIVSGSTIFYNNSHYQGYLYPDMTITTGSATAGITIVNMSDDDREFVFTELSPYETLTINNDLGIITSSLGTRRLANFNKNFFRFVPGLNNLSFSGSNINQITMTYSFARRIGG